MKITVVKGSTHYIDDCEDALVNSQLGVRYFSKEGSARKKLEDGFAKEEIYVAIDDDDTCKGFIMFSLDGMFHSYPYLNIVAVKKESRNQGIGRILLKFFEQICFKDDYKKLFLVVADFNKEAKMLYERIGYIEVGAIPNLYREGITEHLMMKLKKE